MIRRLTLVTGLTYLMVLAWVLLAPSPAVDAQTAPFGSGRASKSARTESLTGGPRGVVRLAAKGQPVETTIVHPDGVDRGVVETPKGQPVDGVMVQLISKTTAIRTTVYTDELGRYEFPKLPAAEYTLRIPRPLEFRRYQKDVRIDGATTLPDIVVESLTQGGFLPPTPDILPQMTASELIENVPGTVQEKRAFVNQCGSGCHTLDYVFRVKYDEASWRKLVHRMTGYTFRTLVPRNGAGNMGEDGYVLGGNAELVAKWLARIRGVDAELPPLKPFPRPHGPATRAVVTEYELPWALASVHDVGGDADGNIWFSINRNPFVGKLDATTGKVTAYRTPKPPPSNIRYIGDNPSKYKHPDPPGVTPGLHWIQVDHNTGLVWFSDTWAEADYRLDPKTGDIQVVNTGLFGNQALAPDGKSLWRLEGGVIRKYDTSTMMSTGKPVQEWPLNGLRSTYGNWISWDNKYLAGGSFFFDMKTGETRRFAPVNGAAAERGDFDPEGNSWAGSSGGGFQKYDPKTGAIVEYVAPVPWTRYYTARADKNGDIWAGEMHAGRIARFNPRTTQWIEYVLPTPWALDFNSWVDNATDPPTYWYGDEYGFITRVQPRN